MAAVLLTTIALAGCTGGSADAEPSQTPATTAVPAPDASSETPGSTAEGADAEADAALLPIPVDDIREWAETAVPAPSAGTGAGALSGWLSQNTSSNQKNTFASVEPGTFQGQIACRGEGTITVAAGEVEGEGEGDLEGDSALEPVTCRNSTIAFDVTTTRQGVRIDLGLEGAPAMYAVSLTRVG
ncbi:hypothetical protein [Microbacterium sp.]|uniref:hypothetical protein n=1 Tax=Microbacterium sp. TaxID=51671 RepID=UPI00391D6412